MTSFTKHWRPGAAALATTALAMVLSAGMAEVAAAETASRASTPWLGSDAARLEQPAPKPGFVARFEGDAGVVHDRDTDRTETLTALKGTIGFHGAGGSFGFGALIHHDTERDLTLSKIYLRDEVFGALSFGNVANAAEANLFRLPEIGISGLDGIERIHLGGASDEDRGLRYDFAHAGMHASVSTDETFDDIAVGVSARFGEDLRHVRVGAGVYRFKGGDQVRSTSIDGRMDAFGAGLVYADTRGSGREVGGALTYHVVPTTSVSLIGVRDLDRATDRNRFGIGAAHEVTDMVALRGGVARTHEGDVRADFGVRLSF